MALHSTHTHAHCQGAICSECTALSRQLVRACLPPPPHRSSRCAYISACHLLTWTGLPTSWSSQVRTICHQSTPTHENVSSPEHAPQLDNSCCCPRIPTRSALIAIEPFLTSFSPCGGGCQHTGCLRMPACDVAAWLSTMHCPPYRVCTQARLA